MPAGAPLGFMVSKAPKRVNANPTTRKKSNFRFMRLIVNLTLCFVLQLQDTWVFSWASIFPCTKFYKQ